tara:strand:+ start:2998 stop:3501 length:504 start_codon:yes stop_codon:yes gene_type:complete
MKTDNEECVELKNLKYKSMRLNKNPEEKKETVENVNNLHDFLHNDKNTYATDNWTKLNKTDKLRKFQDFSTSYCLLNEYSEVATSIKLYTYLADCINKKRLLKSKEVLYNGDIITSIPALTYSTSHNIFTLNRCEKRESTIKSLTPKKKSMKNVKPVPTSPLLDDST